MAVTTKKTFPATSNANTTVFNNVGIQLNNQDDLDVYVTLVGGTRVLQNRNTLTNETAQSGHKQVNDTTGLYFPAVAVGTALYNYTLSSDNNTITFNSAPANGVAILIYLDEWYSLQPVIEADNYLANDIALTGETIFSLPYIRKQKTSS